MHAEAPALLCIQGDKCSIRRPFRLGSQGPIPCKASTFVRGAAVSEQPVEVSFFGLKICVRNEKLAAVLNSSVTDDVGVVIDRAWGDPADEHLAFRQGAARVG